MKKIAVLILVLKTSLFSFAQQDLDSNKKWTIHFQLTAINQTHPSFSAKYSGSNSLINTAETEKLSLTTTLFLGRKLWKNAGFYLNPEITGGAGLSGAKGVAGFTNGETFRIGSTEPKFYLARIYFRQYIPLKNTGYSKVENGPNQLEESVPTSRITITAGKISLSDYFDLNKYSHDPRGQFLNWSLMSNGAWDYPADTRGYTQGFVAELVKPGFALRFSSVLMPRKANGLQMDYKVSKAHSETIELEKNWTLKRPGAIRLLAFRSVSQAPTYTRSLAEAARGDFSSIKEYTGEQEWKIYGGVKYGFALNTEQELTDNTGAFLKASWNDGKTATWAFTEIDRSISFGLNIKGTSWKRANDIIGIAQVINGISAQHSAFLRAGYYGFIIGDGQLNYGAESITEFYYKARITKSFFLSFDYQFVNNPAYNIDRGPVNVFAFRGHVEF